MGLSDFWFGYELYGIDFWRPSDVRQRVCYSGEHQEFKKTGTWPDKTVFALEVRGSEQKVSINKRGHSQGDVMGVEVHVKDAKLPGGFGFFEFDPGQATAKLVPQKESCYTCHREHAAVDTTFVQFYPTLMPIAKEKKTLSPAYLKEIAEPKN